MKKAENGIDWAAAFTQRRPELRFETVLADFKRRAAKSKEKFEALEVALRRKDKRLLEENMLVIKQGENGWYAAHFRNLAPENVSNAVEVVRELLHIGSGRHFNSREIESVDKLMGVITPFVKDWETLILQFSKYYEDTKIGAELAAKFGQLQAACKLLWTAKDRMRPGTLHFNRDKYTKAFDAFVAYYLDLPRESGKVASKVEDPQIRMEILQYCCAHYQDWLKDVKGSQSMRRGVLLFYDDEQFWIGKRWMTKSGYRRAYDYRHSETQLREDAKNKLLHDVYKAKKRGKKSP